MSCRQLTKYTVDPVSGNITLSGGPDGTVTIVPTNASWDGGTLVIWGGGLEEPLVVPIDLSGFLTSVAAQAPIVGDGTPGNPLGVAPGAFVTPTELTAALAPYLQSVATSAPITGDGTPGDPITIDLTGLLTQADHDASLMPVYGNDGSTVLFRVHAA